MRQIILSFALVAFVLSSCDTKKSEMMSSTNNADSLNALHDSIFTKSDNSRTSIDWVGTYEGILPCADCKGIKTILTLNKNESYALTQEYQDKKLTLSDSGPLYWSADGSSVNIKTPKNGIFYYKVGEGKLFSLDQEGKEITGELASNYILDKID